MSNAPIDNERALARLWDEYDLAKDAESDIDSDSTWGDGAPFPVHGAFFSSDSDGL